MEKVALRAVAALVSTIRDVKLAHFVVEHGLRVANVRHHVFGNEVSGGCSTLPSGFLPSGFLVRRVHAGSGGVRYLGSTLAGSKDGLQ